jgi:hypothetical protein
MLHGTDRRALHSFSEVLVLMPCDNGEGDMPMACLGFGCNRNWMILLTAQCQGSLL